MDFVREGFESPFLSGAVDSRQRATKHSTSEQLIDETRTSIYLPNRLLKRQKQAIRIVGHHSYKEERRSEEAPRISTYCCLSERSSEQP